MRWYTFFYMAPEILGEDPYSTKCDVWSTGIVLYELIFGYTPWCARSTMELFNTIKNTPLQFPHLISPKTRDLIEKMLRVKDEERISWREVLDHAALKEIAII